MVAKLYAEVNQHTIDRLKSQGFTSVQFVLLDQGDPYQASIEIIPGNDQDFELDKVSLYSREIHDFFDWQSPMARYVIEKSF